jgi:hypothetical protein
LAAVTPTANNSTQLFSCVTKSGSIVPEVYLVRNASCSFFQDVLDKSIEKDSSMKNRLIFLAGLVLGAIGVAFLLRREIALLKDEVSNLRETKIKWDSMNEALDELNHKWINNERAFVASLSPQEKLDYEMKNAIFRSKYPDISDDDEVDDA